MSEDMRSQVEKLYEVIVGIKDMETCRNLFEDLCTFKEIESMAQRVEAAKMLLSGATYEQVIKQTGISSATLSRVSKCVKYGNGYKTVLKEDK